MGQPDTVAGSELRATDIPGVLPVCHCCCLAQTVLIQAAPI